MRNTTCSKWLFILAACLALFVIAGCTGSNVSPIEGTARDTVLAKADPITDNLMDSLSKGDYAAFTRDFDPTMKKAMNQAAFEQMVNTLNGKVGQYQSRQISKVEQAGKYYAVTYLCKFEKEDAVSWRVVLSPTDPAQVSGLWYDSPKLREK